MRRFSRLAVFLAACCSMLILMSNALAADVAGAVDGTVTITSPSSGIPTSPVAPCVTTTYSFGAITLLGTFRANDSTVWTGSFSVTGVTGGSDPGAECAGSGSGKVASPTTPAQIPATTNSFGTITGSFYGTYVRTGSYVEVTLQFNANVANGSGNHPATGTVKVRAQFTPTTLNPNTLGITSANFAGQFSTV